jgi:nucleotide-binding universal stress UspA family protein
VYAGVLAAYDGSDRAATAWPPARQLAAQLGRPAELLYVAADGPPPASAPGPLRVIEGADPADALIAAARSTDPEQLLVLASHGRGPVGELVFGSVAAGIVRHLAAPLVVTGPRLVPRPADRWSQLLVCLDGSATSATILPVAARWAEALDLDVDLLHVTTPLGDLPPAAGLSETALDLLEVLPGLAAELRGRGLRATWRIVDHPDAARAISEEAARRHVDLIAMATHGRTGLARLLAGSVAMATVRQAPAPLLLQRPASLS